MRRNDMGASEAGASIDWSKASRGGSFDNDGEGMEGAHTRGKRPSMNICTTSCPPRGLAGRRGPRRPAVLIDAVDEGGYLRADLAETAERLGLRRGSAGTGS